MARLAGRIQLSMRDSTTKERLEQLALRYGYKWGTQPNISGFVEAIAQGWLEIKGENYD